VKNKVKALCIRNSKIHPTLLKKYKVEIDEMLIDVPGNTINEKIYILLNDFFKRPQCYCGNNVSFESFTKGFKSYCSTKCAANSLQKQQKIKQTNLKKYGVENVNQLKKFKEKAKQTNLKKYGVEYSSQSKIVKQKKHNTNIKRYGNKSTFSNKNVNTKVIITKKKKFYKNLQNRNKNKVEATFMENEYMNDNYSNKYSWKCKICDTEFNDNIDNGHIPRCPTCFPIYKSKPEEEIASFIKSLNINIIENDRKTISPMELDIYIPDYNVAIEFDGLYWHSDKFKEKNYHIDKTMECEKKDIHLIHIFEDEWLNRQEIVKARLKNLLGLNSKRIGARKTIIKEISPKVKNEFVANYHIQGKDSASIKLGAFYNDELVGVMTFSKPRIFMSKKAKDGSWELSRFVTIPDTYTPGLASKMLKYFERNWNPKLIESFADRRWSQGNLYKKLGFELASQTNPNYYYFKDNQKRWHRYKFRKSELTKFDNYTPEKTEKEIMNEAGWGRIYDCGNYKFAKKYDIE